MSRQSADNKKHSFLRSFLRKLRKFTLWVLLLFFGSSILAVLAYRWIPVKYTPLMFIRLYQQSGNHEPGKLHHEWVPLEEMSPHIPVAVWASEDQRFFLHNGFDMEAIKEAIKEAEAGKRQRGASTISQQTAKNVFLWPHSDWFRKGLEAYFTFLIEMFWSKERIMEVYLNSIEMGNGIYGVEAVAIDHFGCHAKDLTKQQCAMIAASLPNPLKFNSGSPSRYMYKRQSQILKQMRNLGGRFPTSEEIKDMREKGRLTP